jgi:hypothetical protein
MSLEKPWLDKPIREEFHRICRCPGRAEGKFLTVAVDGIEQSKYSIITKQTKDEDTPRLKKALLLAKEEYVNLKNEFYHNKPLQYHSTYKDKQLQIVMYIYAWSCAKQNY